MSDNCRLSVDSRGSMSKLLTVIMPAHDSATSIEYSVESILNQSYKEIEIIIVDDSSNDETRSIIEKFKANPGIIALYNASNQGPAICRNIGLSQCNTKYVTFLDSDDWIDMNCYQRALEILESNSQVDICAWDIETVYSRHHSLPRYEYKYENIITSSYALDMYSRVHQNSSYFSPLLGNKVLRTDVINNNNLNFHGWFYEDDVFIFRLLLESKLIALIPDCKLYYFQREGSLMHSFSEMMINELFDSFQRLYSEISKRSDWLSLKTFYYCYLEKCIFNLIRICKTCNCSDIERNVYYEMILNSIASEINLSEYGLFCNIGDLFNA